MVSSTKDDGVTFDTAVLAHGIFGVVEVFGFQLVWVWVYGGREEGT